MFIVVLVFELFDLIALGYLIALFGTKEMLFQLGDVISMLMLIGMLILVLLAVAMIWFGVRAFLLRSNIVVEGIVERGN